MGNIWATPYAYRYVVNSVGLSVNFDFEAFDKESWQMCSQ